MAVEFRYSPSTAMSWLYDTSGERPCHRLAARQRDELAAVHVAPSPWQFAQQLLRNAYDVVFTVIKARW